MVPIRYYGLRGLALMILPFTGFDIVSLSIFAVFYGLDWVATVPPTVALTNEVFGRRDAPVIPGQVRLLPAPGRSRAGPGRAGQDGRKVLADEPPTAALPYGGRLLASKLDEPTMRALQQLKEELS